MIGLKRRRLVRALAARDDATRWAAAKELSQTDDPSTTAKVERVLERGKEPEARAAAAYVLGFSGDTSLGVLLAERLADADEATLVRAHAAEALGHLLQHEQVHADVRVTIVTALRDHEAEVRFWSAFAAGVLGLQESRPHLERLTRDDARIEGWWSIGEEARWALRCLDGEEDPPLPGRASEPASSRTT